MKTLLTTLCLTIAVLLGSIGNSESADFQNGLTAAQSGDFATALREFTPLAEQGNAGAQSSLGFMYEKGQGVPQDYKTAVKWYTLAAKQGNALAQSNLGVMYAKGQGVPQNYKTAVKWYTLSAEQGNALAQFNLGVMNDKGKGVPQDDWTAVFWYRLAAEQGYAPAQFNQGVMYAKGQGVPQDYKTAVKWIRLAAKQGFASAQYNLGVMYERGRGVPQDDKTAVKWIRLAAKQGFARAQGNLGVMYENGRGVPQNYKTALKWYRLAAKKGFSPAKNNLSRIQKKIARTGDTPTVTAKKSPTPSSKVNKKIDKMTLPMTLDWEGIADNIRGTVTVPELTKWKKSEVPVEFRLGLFSCNGSSHYRSGNWKGEGTTRGVFSVKCSNGRVITGTYTSPKAGEGIGSGKDDTGANVVYHYGMGASKVTNVTAKQSPPPSSSAAEQENEKLRKEVARLKKQNQSKPKQVAKKTPQPTPEPKTSTSGSGFFVSKSGHVITNQHIVNKCKKVTVGDNAEKQVAADIIETDRENDLALLKLSSLKMASVETKSLIQKLGIKIVPLASDGLLRFEDVDLGEDVLVAGYPYGEIFSDSIKVTKGIVSASKGFGDDSGQFQMDAAVQPGNSGGPIYDENGNIVGVVVAQLNKMKFAKQSGSMPENVNFGIKASTVRQFLSSSGLPTKWSKRSKSMSTKEIAKIAENQTVMVMCHQ